MKGPKPQPNSPSQFSSSSFLVLHSIASSSLGAYMLQAYAVAFVSLLAGASVVHYTLRPDLSIPNVDADAEAQNTQTKNNTKKTTNH